MLGRTPHQEGPALGRPLAPAGLPCHLWCKTPWATATLPGKAGLLWPGRRALGGYGYCPGTLDGDGGEGRGGPRGRRAPREGSPGQARVATPASGLCPRSRLTRGSPGRRARSPAGSPAPGTRCGPRPSRCTAACSCTSWRTSSPCPASARCTPGGRGSFSTPARGWSPTSLRPGSQCLAGQAPVRTFRKQ